MADILGLLIGGAGLVLLVIGLSAFAAMVRSLGVRPQPRPHRRTK